MASINALCKEEPERRMGARSVFTNQLVLLLLTLLLFCAFPAHAQKYLGTFTGEISDPSGAKIVNATVTATATSTHFSTKAVSNKTGHYSIPFLTPDTYIITVKAPGFKTGTTTNVILTAGADVRTDFTLDIGNSNQTVTVSATTPLLDPASASLGTTFTEKQVHDLPNEGQVPDMVAALSAGAYDSAYIGGHVNSTLVPWGGGPTAISGNGIQGFTRPTIDGVPDDALERIGTSQGGPYTAFTPPLAAVQEVKSQTALYDAEYGHGSGMVINSILRSGTNQYHGAAYYIFRNTYLNANTYERVPNQNGAINPSSPTPRSNGTWNQPGFELAGPVRIPHLYNGHDKTFFMIAYEHIQLDGRTGNSGGAGATALVPTAAEDNGDFSALCPGGFNSNGACNPGGGVQIYDPQTLDANNNRTPFPYNKIPSNRFDPTGVALLKYFPAPNTNLSPVINYVSTDVTIPENYYALITRVDHSINDNNKWSAVFDTQVLSQVISNQGFPTPIGPTSTDDDVYRNNHGGSFDYVSVLPHSWVVDARIGLNYHPFGVIYKGSPYDLSSIGINSNGLAYPTFPGLSFSDSYVGLQAGSGSQVSTDTYFTGAAIVSKVLGSHTLRFGFEGELHRYNAQNPFSGLGTFAYNREFTQKNSVNVAVGADTSSGNPIASLLLGYPSSGSYSNQVAFAIQQPYQAYFIQDNWRATQKLTFNMGLRWEYEAPYTERYNKLNTGFCTTCTNPLQDFVSGLKLLGGLQFASSSHRGYYKPQYDEFQPRFGISYELTPQIILHSGAALIYPNAIEGPIGQGFSASTSYIATNDSTHPATSLANPFPGGVNQPSGSSLGLATQIGQSLSFIAPNRVNPKILLWTASTQTQLPADMVLQIAYAGNKTWNWGVNKNINGLPAQYYNQGPAGITYLQAKVPNPMAGLIAANGTLNAPTIQRQYLLLPYPEFGSVTEVGIPSGQAQYNALQVTLNKSMGHDFSILGTFTWQKMMESFEYLNATDIAPYRYEDGNPNLMGNLAVMYQLPRFSGSPGYERSIFGGWQLNGILRAYNGTLVSNPSGVSELSNPQIGHATYGRYFNTCYLNAAGARVMTTQSAPACDSASSIPAFQQHYSFTLNTVGPNMESVRTHVHPIVDLSLFKTFPLHENVTMEIRGEFFNAFNTANFGGPGTTPGSSNYGEVTLTQANDPRIGQLIARFNF